MKTIYNIARTELQTLFFSPIAWLILIIFTFQSSMAFADVMGGMVRNQALGYGLRGVTLGVYASPWGGLFPIVQQYLYLYIPLLTMSLMSRELGSGSIKLLYSSPVTNIQIILGKYLSMMIYALVLIGVLMVYVLFTAFTVKMLDFPAILSGLLGLYLLICAYAAVGLFMSSLTSYQVVAAMGTLAVLAVLNFVGGMWQDIAFVRDITYWLSISGRCDEFISGLICSEDLLYFIIVIALFLSLAIIRLQACRQKTPWAVSMGKYVGVVCIAMILGYLTSRPTLMAFYDATRTKVRTLTENSQDVVKRLEGGLTITTYTNALEDGTLWYATPRYVNQDLERFKQYTRFKPEIEMKYVYYYDTVNNPDLEKRYPGLSDRERMVKICNSWGLDSNLFITPEQIRQQIDLFPEGNRFVRLIERENGQKTFLRVYDDMMRFPSESEITAALKRLVMKLPKVGFLTGHGERDNKREGDRDYNRFAQDKPFRYSLINQGFDFCDVALDKEIPEDVSILVIAEMRSPMTAEEKVYLDKYIAKGGNLLILGEPKRRDVMNPLVEQFGVQFVPGTLVKPSENFLADFIITDPTKEAGELSYAFDIMRKYEYKATMPNVSGLEYTEGKGFTMTPLFKTDSLVWNELQVTNFVDDTVKYDPEKGEIQKSYVTGLALSRKVGEKEQKIIIFGDADCISNGEISIGRKNVDASNYTIITGGFFWMSDNEVPIDVRRPTMPDNKVYLGETGMYVSKIGFMGVFPGILAIFAILIWIRRRGR
ncbi:Gldg family protein [Gabonibacter chumensis]|uniref:Gldg family protein n=1 Tax=Gabonibacter chumensis TaxID=2972474 RepID=UPI0025735581|nr:Gldg family protein [Gabonibacter chumensis]MCR9013322.1 Gldg family protein [Gabonibacter chumensis]